MATKPTTKSTEFILANIASALSAYQTLLAASPRPKALNARQWKYFQGQIGNLRRQIATLLSLEAPK